MFGVGARRVQPYLVRMYDWSPREGVIASFFSASSMCENLPTSPVWAAGLEKRSQVFSVVCAEAPGA